MSPLWSQPPSPAGPTPTVQYKRQMNRDMANGLQQMAEDEKAKKAKEEEDARREKEAALLLPGAAEAAAAAELKRLKVRDEEP